MTAALKSFLKKALSAEGLDTRRINEGLAFCSLSPALSENGD